MTPTPFLWPGSIQQLRSILYEVSHVTGVTLDDDRNAIWLRIRMFGTWRIRLDGRDKRHGELAQLGRLRVSEIAL